MKKTKLTRTLMAAVSIVALSAVMYGCTHSGDDGPTAAELAAEQERAGAAEQAQMDLDAAVTAVEAARMAVAGVSADMSTAEEVAAARTKVTEAQTAVMKLPEGNDLHASIAGIASDLAGIEMAQANAANEQTRAMQFETVNAALGMAQTAVNKIDLDQAGSTDADIASARTLVTAAETALDAATALTDEQRMSLDGMITALGTRLMDIDEYRATDAGQLAVANAAVDAAEGLVDALTDDSTPEEVGAAHAALQRATQAVAAAVNLPDNVRTALEERIAKLEGQAESQHGITMALAEATTAVTGLNADSSTAEEVAAARAKVDAAKQAVMELEDDDPRKTAVANLDAQLMGIETAVAARPTPEEIAAEEARVAAATKAAGTKEKAIEAEAGQTNDAGLGGTARTDANGGNEATADDVYSLTIKRPRSGTEVEITDPNQAGDDDPKFTQAMDLGDGTTMHVRMMKADDDGNVESEVVIVSTDIEAPKATDFEDVPGQALNADLDTNTDADNDGTADNDLTALWVGANASTEPDEAVRMLVTSAAFAPRSGDSTTHTFARYQLDSDDGTDGNQTVEAFTTAGTYNDAMGTYRCSSSSADCTVTVDDEGEITGMSAGWTFAPAEGAVSYVPDADFLYFGVWLKRTRDEDGAVTYNEVETFADSSITASGSVSAVTGKATYNGDATGVYVHSVSNTDGTRASATSGHFTADATLTAYFAQTVDDEETNDVDEAGQLPPNKLFTLTGTIDEFDLDGHDEGPGWSVALESSAAPNTDSDGTLIGTAMGGMGDGSFTATFHGSVTPVDGGVAPQPSSVVGEFNAGFSNGSVAGAFGATRDEE